MKNTKDSIFDTDAQKLASLFEDEKEQLWQENDLAAVFKHQLSAPVEFDLGQFDRKNIKKIKNLAESHHLLLKSFRDLFMHSNPPLELLEMVKKYAKYCMMGKNSIIPKEVAAVLYYTSIAVAATKCNQNMTKLKNNELKEGFKWVLERKWIDKDIKDIIKVAQVLLESRICDCL